MNRIQTMIFDQSLDHPMLMVAQVANRYRGQLRDMPMDILGLT
jgi:hypothetical protein